MKYNIGDKNQNVSYANLGIKRLPTKVSSTACDNENKEPCMWSGVTSDFCNANNGCYSGCNRTVANYYAAKLFCQNYAQKGTKKGSWRLSTPDEAANFATLSTSKGADGLMLCGGSLKSGNAGCSDTLNMTYGSSSSADSYVYRIKTSDENIQYSFFYGYKRVSVEPNITTSVRCVLDGGIT